MFLQQNEMDAITTHVVTCTQPTTDQVNFAISHLVMEKFFSRLISN